MNVNDRRKIIAIFGGNVVDADVLSSARRMAQLLIAQGVAVMTGAGPRPNRSQVKGVALKEAQDKCAAWIGVHNCWQAERPEPAAEPSDCGLTVHPLMGEQRNFLEALLCDAAVVLPGGSGAISEAVSMLCLGKPVLLGGTRQHWQQHRCESLYELFHSQTLDVADAAQLIERAKGPLGSGGPLQVRIEIEVSAERLRNLPAYCSLAPSSVDAINSWIRAVVQLGCYPEIAGHGHAKMQYEGWLASDAMRP